MSEVYEFKPGGKKKDKEEKQSKFTREQWIAEIRAILAKTVERGASRDEAKNAAGLAKKLMDQHDITMDDIKAAEEAEATGDPGVDWGAFFHMFMSEADMLVDIGARGYLFHAPDRTCYADVMVDGHRETWGLASKDYKRWLTSCYYKATRTAPRSEAMRMALATLDAMAANDGPEHEVYVRVAGHDGKIYLDLCDSEWRAVETDRDGWRVVKEPPVRFRRKDGMRPLPVPDLGAIDILRPFVNSRMSDGDFALVVSWLLAGLRPSGPYPILVLGGEQGTAKSTLARILRSLIDPNTVPLRALPENDREFCISARNAYVLCYDNVSGIPAGISDMMCRTATGGGSATRQLYTDTDEILFDGQRPQLVNGISDIINRPDLAERSGFIVLKHIPKKERKTVKELDARFEAARPRILGALLDAVAFGLKHPVTLTEMPRMADFAEWMVSCEPAMWEPGTFMRAYDANIEDATETMIEANPVATAIRDFMEKRTEWRGTADTLLDALNERVGEKVSRRKEWPQSARGLSSKLTRFAPNLRSVGIEIVHGERTGRARPLRLYRVEERPSQPSQQSEIAEDCGNLGDGSNDAVTVGGAVVTVGKKQLSPKKPLEDKENDGDDGGDGLVPHREYGHDQFSAIRLEPKVAKPK